MNRLYYLQTHKNHGTVFISYQQNGSYHGVQTEAKDAVHGLERALTTIKELNLAPAFEKEVEIYKKTYINK